MEPTVVVMVKMSAWLLCGLLCGMVNPGDNGAILPKETSMSTTEGSTAAAGTRRVDRQLAVYGESHRNVIAKLFGQLGISY